MRRGVSVAPNYPAHGLSDLLKRIKIITPIPRPDRAVEFQDQVQSARLVSIQDELRFSYLYVLKPKA